VWRERERERDRDRQTDIPGEHVGAEEDAKTQQFFFASVRVRRRMRKLKNFSEEIKLRKKALKMAVCKKK
jgi:hypothetical protein